MRLICPNCGAQYEVPDDVIPASGRDVQCSNCGNTWFQVHPEQDVPLADELDQPLPDDTYDEDDSGGDDGAARGDSADGGQGADDWVEPDTPLGADPRGADEAEKLWDDDAFGDAWDEDSDGVSAGAMPSPPSDDYDDDYESWEETPPPPSPGAGAENRRSLDPDVADLLREEAEREARQRASERGTLESQPELGLEPSGDDEDARRQREAQERMARLRGTEPPETDPGLQGQAAGAAAAAAAAAASRRDLLPDIDEINSTLRSSDDRRPAAAADDHERPGDAPQRTDADVRRGGFKRGFLLVILLMVLAILLYVYAPRLAQSVPALEAPLAAYVEMMNGLRLWIDAQLRGVLGWLDSMSGDA